MRGPDLTSFVDGLPFGIGLASFALCLFVAWRPRTRPALRWTLTIYCLSATANFLSQLLRSIDPEGWGQSIAIVLSHVGSGHTGFVWAMILVLFADRRLSSTLWAPALAIIAARLVMTALAANFGDAPWAQATFQGINLTKDTAELVLRIHIVVVMVLSWRGDLIESRRRLRVIVWGPAFTVFAVLQAAAFAREHFGLAYGGIGALSSWLQAVFLLATTMTLVDAREDLLVRDAPSNPNTDTSKESEALPEASPLSPSSRKTLARLDAAMKRDEVWRRDGLTLAALAAEARTSERVLRRLINEHLGHRNFAAFLNSYRIPAAQAALSDATNADKTIAAIAYDLGYSSIAPFNRAFREATGQTPTAFRNAAKA